MTIRSRRLLGLGAALAGAAFLALRRGDIPFDVLEWRYAGRGSRFLEIADGTVVHVSESGRADAPVLVLLHGYAASTLDWAPWTALLARRYRVVSLDFPGHGLTAAPAEAPVTLAGLADLVDTVVQRLRLDRFVLIGNSMGGQVACRYALLHPERLAGLVLINPLIVPPRPAEAPSPIFRLLATAVGRALLRNLDLTPLVRRSLVTAFGDARLVTPALVRRYTDLARAPGHRTILTTLQIGGGDGLLGQLRAIGVPTLVMVGEEDRLIAAAVSRRVAQAIWGATLIVYPGVGHVPMQQIPDRSAADLDAWVRATTNATAA